jgi:hypothetical protein
LIQPGADVELLRVPILSHDHITFGDVAQLRLSDVRLSTPEALAVRVEGFDAELPTSFSLEQNYPNPFNPTTTIEFAIGNAANGALTQNVKLEIYNILGQRVTTLVDDKMPPGQYTVEWDATNARRQKVSSGIYLYRLQVNEATESKKMVLLK